MFDETTPNLPGIFLFGHYLESYSKKDVKMDHTNIYPEDLDSLCQEISNGGLGIVVHSPSGLLSKSFSVCG